MSEEDDHHSLAMSKMEFVLDGKFMQPGLGRDWAGIRSGQNVGYKFQGARDKRDNEEKKHSQKDFQTTVDNMFINLPEMRRRVNRIGLSNKDLIDEAMISEIANTASHEGGHEAHSLADPHYGFISNNALGTGYNHRSSDRNEMSGYRSFRADSPGDMDSMQEKVAYMLQNNARPIVHDSPTDDIVRTNQRDQGVMRGLRVHPDVGSRYEKREKANPRLLSIPRQGRMKDRTMVDRIFQNLENASMDRVMDSGLNNDYFTYGDSDKHSDRIWNAKRLTKPLLSELRRHKKKVLSGKEPLPTSYSMLPPNIQDLIGQGQMRESLAESVRERDPYHHAQEIDDPIKVALGDPEGFMATHAPLTDAEFQANPDKYYKDYPSYRFKSPYVELDSYRLSDQEHEQFEQLMESSGAEMLEDRYVFKPTTKRPLTKLPRPVNYPTANQAMKNLLPTKGSRYSPSEEIDWGDDE
tara:strand:- start:1636 stop:3033 length:1398 start_codon:yes stop_codon:yes gene_type:complete